MPRQAVLNLSPISLVLLFVISPLGAQQAGDTVIIVAPVKAELTVDNRAVTTIPRGAGVVVESLGPESLRVRWQSVCGWISKADTLGVDDAISYFKRAIKNRPTASDHWGCGNAWFCKGDYDRAIASFTKAIGFTSDYAPVYRISRGLAYAAKGDLDKAISDYTEAIHLSPEYDGAYHARGIAYDKKGDLDKAISDYAEVIRLSPKCAAAYHARGLAYDRKGDSERAVSDYLEAIRLDPKFGQAYYDMAWVYADRGEMRKAVANYTEAIQLGYDVAASRYGRARAYARLEDYDNAIADCTEAIRRNPEYVDAYVMRGVSYLRKQQYERAIADQTDAIRLDSRNADLYYWRGVVHEKKGEKSKAAVDYSTAITLRPQSACFYEKRGSFWITQGEYDRGIADIRTAIQLNPKDQAAKFEDWQKNPVSEDALRHGKGQLRQMLKDREAMDRYGKAARPLHEWASRKFAGEDLGKEIYWDSTEPPSPFDGCCQPPTEKATGCIRSCGIHRDGPDAGKKRSFEEAWCTAVYELYNIMSAKDFAQVDREAASGKISKEEFVTRFFSIEDRAAERTRSFYIHVFLPWAKEHHIATNPEIWYLAAEPDSSELSPKYCTERGSSLWRNYESCYDTLVEQGKAEKHKPKKDR